MKKPTFISLLILSVSLSGCGQTNSNENSKDDIKFNEQAQTSPTKNLTAAENYSKGYNAFHSDDYIKAIKYYRKAIKQDPNYIDAYDNCGVAYRRMGNLDSAAYYYKKSIQINPKTSIAHGNLAIVYTEQGKLQEAIQEYGEISKYNPNDPEAPYGIAGLYIQMKQYDKALPIAKKSAELFEKYQPQYVGDAYYYVGLSYLYLKENKNAKEYFYKAIQKGTQVPQDILKAVE